MEENEDLNDSVEMIGGNQGLPRYLTGIISSPLSWIEDEQTQVDIWEAASKRLSERSGRTGLWSLYP